MYFIVEITEKIGQMAGNDPLIRDKGAAKTGFRRHAVVSGESVEDGEIVGYLVTKPGADAAALQMATDVYLKITGTDRKYSKG